jgi:undecaprenyl-diphosphatase
MKYGYKIVQDKLGILLTRLGVRLACGIAGGGALLVLFAKMVEDLLSQELSLFDTIVTHVIQSIASPLVTEAAIFITQLGSADVLIGIMIISGIILWLRLGYRWETLMLAISLAGASLLNILLKYTFRRARPEIEHLVEVGGYSFPSGHSMVSASFYGMLAYIIWSYLREKEKPSWPVIIIGGVLILLIGLSRIYLGVHFPSDVVAGFAAGGVWTFACIIGLELLHRSKSKK